MLKLALTAIMLTFTGIAFAQNVGIGTINPSEKLEVVGNLKADSFKLAAPVLHYKTIGAMDFHIQRGSNDGSIEGTDPMGASRYVIGGGTNIPINLIAGFTLPDNATMIGATLYSYDFDPNNEIAADMYVNSQPTYHTNPICLIPATIGSTPVTQETQAAPFSHAVDNVNYFYVVRVKTRTNNSLLRVKSVRIAYTVTSVD